MDDKLILMGKWRKLSRNGKNNEVM